jgi:hypothetical protein
MLYSIFCRLIDWIGVLRSLHVPSVTDPRAVSPQKDFSYNKVQNYPLLTSHHDHAGKYYMEIVFSKVI